jgi:hypothetical protein
MVIVPFRTLVRLVYLRRARVVVSAEGLVAGVDILSDMHENRKKLPGSRARKCRLRLDGNVSRGVRKRYRRRVRCQSINDLGLIFLRTWDNL